MAAVDQSQLSGVISEIVEKLSGSELESRTRQAVQVRL